MAVRTCPVHRTVTVVCRGSVSSVSVVFAVVGVVCIHDCTLRTVLSAIPNMFVPDA